MLQFRTKARAVDLLGKGQIADLPTAITELWKNGYDAYADVLKAEIFLSGYKGLTKPIFSITDDGKGMSEKDILEKWLVLGTDSKSRTGNSDTEGLDTLFKKVRIKAGEKGIGRLSVAFLGSPMLMLTKKRGYNLQALYFDWRILENYNLFLEDVQIPILEIKSSSDINTVFTQLKKEFLTNFEKEKDYAGNIIWEKSQVELKEKIVAATKGCILPDFFEDDVIADIINKKDHNGTKFFIFEPEQQILDLLSADAGDTYQEFVRGSLAGFTNMFKSRPLPIKSEFLVHKSIGNDYDFLTGSGNFFEPSDYSLSDVLIEGKFNGLGAFKGTIKLYDEKPFEFEYSSPRKKDTRSFYGPFNIKLGYLMGKPDESKLDDLVYNKMDDKLKRFGALYIYRDGFRVLPYGRTDFDFLEFEKKRSKRASTAFFSHRRMFGYIEITRKENENLKDKAGREGLISNSSYRAFKADLEGFFDDLAKEYFSDKAKTSTFLSRKDDIKQKNESLKKDKEREKQEKSAFTRSLTQYPKLFADLKDRYGKTLTKLEKILDNAKSNYSDIEESLDDIKRLEIEYKGLLPEIPSRYKPTDTQLDRLSSYEQQLDDFNGKVRKLSNALIRKAKLKLEVKDLKNEFEKSYQLYKAELESLILGKRKELSQKVTTLFAEYDERTHAIQQELDYQKAKSLEFIATKDDVIAELDVISEKYDFLREQLSKEIFPLVAHISHLDFDIDEEVVQGLYRDEYEKIVYQWDQTRETAQLGIAVEIIDHEFNVLYSQINLAIKKLDGDLGKNSPATFEQLKTFFSQLEDKYALLSPLYRIAGVNAKDISGKSIAAYLLDFFGNKIEEEQINFSTTKEFDKHIINIKEPVIHTVFINVVNNAIYWLRNADQKEISIDYRSRTGEILIMNSGPKIPEHRIKKIFDLFYSNRPNGRGIGLYLAKQSLEENYFDIYATNDPLYNQLGGACFVIKSLKEK